MDSMEYGAVPQHRPRLYICGLPASVSKAKTPFPWPKPLSAPSLKSVLDKHPQKQKTQKGIAYPSAPQAAMKVKAATNELGSMTSTRARRPSQSIAMESQADGLLIMCHASQQPVLQVGASGSHAKAPSSPCAR